MTQAPADLILTGGTVKVLDPASRVAEAVAIKGNRILAVGTAKEIAAFAGPKTEMIDVAGGVVIPGFNDSHAHMDREGLKSTRLSLAGARSVAEITARIADAAGRAKPGQWIVTMPIGQRPFYFEGLKSLAEGRMPTRHELDRAAPNNPVCISAIFGNWSVPPGYTALNSEALRLNRIDRNTRPQTSGVEILKDEAGEPTGVIVESNPRPTIDNDLLLAVPRFTYEERREAIVESMRLYNAVGTTSVYEGHGLAPRTLDAYRELRARGRMNVRVGVVLSPVWEDLKQAADALADWKSIARAYPENDPWLRLCGLHVAFGGDKATAALSRRSLPDTGWAGFVEQANDEAAFREYAMLCAQHDVRLNAIVGDNLERVVPILEEVGRRYDLRGRRWVIQHVARSRREDLAALKRLDMVVTTIPVYYLWKNGVKYLDERDSAYSVVPHRTMLDLGLPVSSATDNIPYDPAFTLWTSAVREERTTGRVIGPDECLSGEQALRLLTVNGAGLTFEEKEKGPLLPGYLADITVLSDDPAAMPPARLRDLKCHLTIVDGRVVHRTI
jgi:predicted amidohydrolase YtcJ